MGRLTGIRLTALEQPQPLGEPLVEVALDVTKVVDAIAAAVAARLEGTARGVAPQLWLDVAGAALHLGCTEGRVRKLAASGRLPVHQERRGGRLYFNRKELDEWMLSI